jgi:hypothetical protein
MDDFGGLFGAIGRLFGGVVGAVGEGAGEAVVAGFVESADDDDDAPGETATYERYLAGAPRALNVNDR